MSRIATYLYGFTRPGAELPAELPGIEETALVRIDEFEGLAAVISEVPVAPFESDAPTDAEWLVPRALRHEHVIEQIHETGPVLPVRFGALFSDARALEIWASSHRSAIDSFLDHVDGKEEWCLELQFDMSSSLEFLTATEPGWARRLEQLSASPGARYFQEKRLREEARADAVRVARRAADRLRTAVRDLTEERLLSRRRQEKPNVTVILDAAYLVRHGDVARFLECAHDAAPQSSYMTLVVSGPWPASHFCPDLSNTSSLAS
jgi:hypothetical protein